MVATALRSRAPKRWSQRQFLEAPQSNRSQLQNSRPTNRRSVAVRAGRNQTVSFYFLCLGILCTWRLTHFLNAEDGPWDVVVRLRERAREGFWADLLDCFYCLSFWLAAPFAVLVGATYLEKGLLWLAFSAGAILLERITEREAGPSPITYIEEKEDQHVVLRQETRGIFNSGVRK